MDNVEGIKRYDVSAMDVFKVMDLKRMYPDAVRAVQTGNYETYKIIGTPEYVDEIVSYCKSKGVEPKAKKVTPTDLKFLEDQECVVESVSNNLYTKDEVINAIRGAYEQFGYAEDALDNIAFEDLFNCYSTDKLVELYNCIREEIAADYDDLLQLPKEAQIGISQDKLWEMFQALYAPFSYEGVKLSDIANCFSIDTLKELYDFLVKEYDLDEELEEKKAPRTKKEVLYGTSVRSGKCIDDVFEGIVDTIQDSVGCDIDDEYYVDDEYPETFRLRFAAYNISEDDLETIENLIISNLADYYEDIRVSYEKDDSYLQDSIITTAWVFKVAVDQLKNDERVVESEEKMPYQGIEFDDYTGKWSAFDSHPVIRNGEKQIYYIFEHDYWGDETCYLVCRMGEDGKPIGEVYETYDDIIQCLEDEDLLTESDDFRITTEGQSVEVAAAPDEYGILLQVEGSLTLLTYRDKDIAFDIYTALVASECDGSSLMIAFECAYKNFREISEEKAKKMAGVYLINPDNILKMPKGE